MLRKKELTSGDVNSGLFHFIFLLIVPISNGRQFGQKILLDQLVVGQLSRMSLPSDVGYIFIDFPKTFAQSRIKLILNTILSLIIDLRCDGRPFVTSIRSKIPNS